MIFLIILLSILSLVGVYWSIFWYRNKDFLMAFLKERNARKDLLWPGVSDADPKARASGATTAT